MSFFKKEKKVKKWFKKIDKIVTSLIIWGTLAGALGIASKTEKWKEIKGKVISSTKSWTHKIIEIFWKTTAKVVWLFSKKK